MWLTVSTRQFVDSPHVLIRFQDRIFAKRQQHESELDNGRFLLIFNLIQYLSNDGRLQARQNTFRRAFAGNSGSSGRHRDIQIDCNVVAYHYEIQLIAHPQIGAQVVGQ